MQKMKERILIFICAVFVTGVTAQHVKAKEFQENLYAESAVLMDADTGRVVLIDTTICLAGIFSFVLRMYKSFMFWSMQ